MSFPELNPYKNKSAEMARLLTKLEEFLQEVLSRPLVLQPLKSRHENLSAIRESQNHAIHPRRVAHYLGVSEPLAIAMLRVCDEAGILEPRYDVYCPETQGFIASFYSPDDLPDNITCPNHDNFVEHSVDEYLVDFMFVFTLEPIVKHYAAAA
jgi:hypothetical protein